MSVQVQMGLRVEKPLIKIKPKRERGEGHVLWSIIELGEEERAPDQSTTY